MAAQLLEWVDDSTRTLLVELLSPYAKDLRSASPIKGSQGRRIPRKSIALTYEGPEESVPYDEEPPVVLVYAAVVVHPVVAGRHEHQLQRA